MNPPVRLSTKMIQDKTDDAMLRQNPDLERYNMRHDNGFIIPIDFKKIIEKEGL